MFIQRSGHFLQCLVLATTLISFLEVCDGSAEREGKLRLQGHPEGRAFSLFNVVSFQNQPCSLRSDSSLGGTCMTNQECQDAGGRQDGNCAAGFGVCCMFTAGCGENVRVNRNCTYLQNAEYPSAPDSPPADGCTYTFNRICPNLCQIRLDFTDLETDQPDPMGVCQTGGFGAESPTGVSPPIVCGSLTGQHMYLETGPEGDAGIAYVVTAGGTRGYRIKVTYYTCDNLAKAPADCVQYFTDLSGSFSSYNFQGGRLIRNQNYNTCFRQAEGYCSIAFAESSSTTDSFEIGQETNAMTTTTDCGEGYVRIPQTNTASNEVICGSLFNDNDDATTAGVVISDVIGTFMVGTVTDDSVSGVGYNLDFNQVPC